VSTHKADREKASTSLIGQTAKKLVNKNKSLSIRLVQAVAFVQNV